jgi:hypothetical protein
LHNHPFEPSDKITLEPEFPDVYVKVLLKSNGYN